MTQKYNKKKLQNTMTPILFQTHTLPAPQFPDSFLSNPEFQNRQFHFKFIIFVKSFDSNDSADIG